MTQELAANGGVLAVLETGVAAEPTVASLEALGAARALAEGLGCELSAAIPAEAATTWAGDLTARGVQRVYGVHCERRLAAPDPEDVESAWAAVQTSSPLAVFFPDSQSARVTAARIAARMDCELVAGCTLVAVRRGEVQLGRPCLGGKAFAQLQWHPHRPVVVTVAAGAFSAPPATTGKQPEVILIEAPPARAASGLAVISEIEPSPEGMGVIDADVLVAGGAGVGGSEGFDLLVELARRLGGTIAASRVAVDRGWIPYERQVGLTGKRVAPRLYLAFGISGAPQHIAGIRSAGKVVAINRDPKAPIFEVADLAVVADLHEIVPALLERLAASATGTRREGN